MTVNDPTNPVTTAITATKPTTELWGPFNSTPPDVRPVMNE